MKTKKIYLGSLLGLITTLFVMFLSTQSAFAQITNPVIGDEIGSVADSCEAIPVVVQYFVLLWKAIINIGAIIVLVMFIYGAVEWLSSGGDSGKLTKARGRLLHAALGMLVLVASFAIISFFSMVFFGENFDILNFSLPTGLDCGGTGGAPGGSPSP